MNRHDQSRTYFSIHDAQETAEYPSQKTYIDAALGWFSKKIELLNGLLLETKSRRDIKWIIV